MKLRLWRPRSKRRQSEDIKDPKILGDVQTEMAQQLLGRFGEAWSSVLKMRLAEASKIEGITEADLIEASQHIGDITKRGELLSILRELSKLNHGKKLDHGFKLGVVNNLYEEFGIDPLWDELRDRVMEDANSPLSSQDIPLLERLFLRLGPPPAGASLNSHEPTGRTQ